MSGSIDVIGTALSVTGDVTVSSVSGTIEIAGTQPAVSLDAVTGNGAGSTVDWGVTKHSHTLYATWTGTPTNLTINIEGSHDGTNWIVLDQTTYTTSVHAKTVASDCRYVRANVISHTGSMVLTGTIASS